MAKGKHKKKNKLRGNPEDLMETVEWMHKQREAKEAKIDDAALFTTAVNKDGLKEKRTKLRADRFADVKNDKTSKVDETLIKRHIARMENREKQGLDPVAPKVIPRSRKFNEHDELGDLEDIWAAPS